MAKQPIKLGQAGRNVAVKVKLLRETQRLTKKQLSDRVSELGRPIPPLGIAKIESGGRRVDADDLVALAVALNVRPAAMLEDPACVVCFGVVCNGFTCNNCGATRDTPTS
ncbi:helix-turn-helix domain-containing protein [Streptomyces sp. NPDC058045]|uniref:helix-turn-helix domain-containing protein n=1 Tax=Streptomyces sp. NPDC058045 TaxID=3346311 RepID=UPI0036E1F4C8